MDEIEEVDPNDEVNPNQDANQNPEASQNQEASQNEDVIETAERSAPSSHITRGTRVPVRMQRDTLFEAGEEAPRIYHRLFEMLFYVLIYAAFALATYFITRAIYAADSLNFNPVKWYLPMITAIGCGDVTAFACHLFVRRAPERAAITVFCASFLMTSVTGLVLMTMESPAGLGIGIPLTVLGFAQAIYWFVVAPHLKATMKIVSAATAVVPDYTTALILVALAIATLYSAALGFAIAGSAAVGPPWNGLAITCFVLSLLWTLHTIKNMVQTMIARVKYKNFAKDQSIPTSCAIRDTMKYLVGSIALGSVVVPVFAVLQGLARALKIIFGKSNLYKYLFEYCYYHADTTLPYHGNRHGFVYAGVYNRGFVQASWDARHVLERSEINDLVDSDKTASFCFFTGLTGAAVSAFVVGCWMRATHQDHVPEIVSFALLIGYLLSRIGTSWVQASMSAYYIAYAEDTDSIQNTTALREWLHELRMFQLSQRQLELSNRRT